MTLNQIMDVLYQRIIHTINGNTGNFKFTVDLNVSQGGIGDAHIETHTKERLKDG